MSFSAAALTPGGVNHLVKTGLLCHLDGPTPSSGNNGVGTTWKDLTTNHNDSTIVGGTTWSTVGGGSWFTDGITGQINTPQLPYNGFVNQSYSIGIWVNPSGQAGNIVTMNGSSGSWVMPPIGSTAQSFYGKLWQNANYANRLFSSAYIPGNWYYLTFVYNAALLTQFFYVNGVLVGSQSNTNYAPSAVSNVLQLGANYTTGAPADGTGAFRGYIGNFHYYGNYALTASDVLQNYNALATRYQGYNTFGNGLSSTTPGFSAQQLQRDYGYTTNGVYWIWVNGKAQQVYCLMDPQADGGGWMMAMKATTGTTFNYSASYWTTANTLNPTDLTRANADAKYDVFNYFQAQDMLAVWPDINTPGGSLSGGYGGNWTWEQKNFYAGTRISPLNMFSSFDPTNGGSIGNYVSHSPYNYGGYFIQDALTFPGTGQTQGIFSTQADIHFYGFNGQNYYNPTYLIYDRVRWGFIWNENGEGPYTSPATLAGGAAPGSDDVGGGIGMDTNFGSYSAGDQINCCQTYTGINRSARVEIYVR